MIYKLVTRAIQYFCFPKRPMWKVGTSSISRKGGVLERGFDLEKGDYDPPFQLCS